MDDMKTLDNLPPDIMPRATDHIDDIIRVVEGLFEKGFAYERISNARQ